MAATGKAAMGDSAFAELVQAEVLRELRPAMTSREFLRFAAKGPSSVASFVEYGDPGAASAPSDDITDITSTALSDTQNSATAAEVGFRVDVSDLAREITPQNLYADAGAIVAASVAEKWETDLAALMDDFSQVITAGSTLTPLDLLAAVASLEQGDVPGPYVAYLDPKQTAEIRVEIATTTAQYESGGRNADKVRPYGVTGYFGEYMGIPIYQTSLVVTTSGLVGGAVFASRQALGCYEIWGPRVENQRDASLRALEFVGTQCYGFVEIDDDRGRTLKSAA